MVDCESNCSTSVDELASCCESVAYDNISMASSSASFNLMVPTELPSLCSESIDMDEILKTELDIKPTPSQKQKKTADKIKSKKVYCI